MFIFSAKRNQLVRPEFKLLLASLDIGNLIMAAEEAGRILKKHSINWDKLYDSALVHSVRPQLGMLLINVPPGLVRPEFMERINEAWRNNLYNQLNFVSEFLRVKALMDDEGVRIVPFKGFLLATEIYKDLGDRESNDVDLYIDVNDIKKVVSIMTNIGYHPSEVFMNKSLDDICKNYGEYNFDRFENGRCVCHFEFHWGMSLPVYGMYVKLNELENQIHARVLQGRVIQVFTPSASFLLLTMHHGGDDRFTLLKHVYDIARFLVTFPDLDWEWILDYAEQFGIENVIYTAVRLASEICGITVPEEISSSVASDKTRKLAANRIQSLTKQTDYIGTFRFNFENWLFRMHSRTGFFLKIRITLFTIRYTVVRLFRI